MDGNSQFFWSRAYEHLKLVNRFASYYNRGWVPQNFKVGALVRYRLTPVSSKALEVSAKMAIKWSKPLVVEVRLGPMWCCLRTETQGPSREGVMYRN